MDQNKGRSFDEIRVGDTASFSITLTKEEHDRFAILSGDSSPVHTDDSFAREHGFAGKIGYAFHISALLSRMYGMYLPGGTSICLRQESNFIAEWYPGDTITVTGTVTRKIVSTKIIEIGTAMLRQDDQNIFRGVGMVKLLH